MAFGSSNALETQHHRGSCRAAGRVDPDAGRREKNAVIVILAQVVLAAGGVGVSMVFTRLLHDSHSSQMRAGAASGVGALSSIAFVLFALLFGVVSKHVGIFHAGWMVVGMTLLASVLLVKAAAGNSLFFRTPKPCSSLRH